MSETTISMTIVNPPSRRLCQNCKLANRNTCAKGGVYSVRQCARKPGEEHAVSNILSMSLLNYVSFTRAKLMRNT